MEKKFWFLDYSDFNYLGTCFGCSHPDNWGSIVLSKILAKIKETFNVHENIFESSKSPRIGPILHLSLSEKPDEPEGSNDASGLHSWHWMRGFYERIEAEKFDNMQNTQWTNKYLKYALKIGNFIPEFLFLPDISSLLFILKSKLSM